MRWERLLAAVNYKHEMGHWEDVPHNVLMLVTIAGAQEKSFKIFKQQYNFSSVVQSEKGTKSLHLLKRKS